MHAIYHLDLHQVLLFLLWAEESVSQFDLPLYISASCLLSLAILSSSSHALY